MANPSPHVAPPLSRGLKLNMSLGHLIFYCNGPINAYWANSCSYKFEIRFSYLSSINKVVCLSRKDLGAAILPNSNMTILCNGRVNTYDQTMLRGYFVTDFWGLTLNANFVLCFISFFDIARSYIILFSVIVTDIAQLIYRLFRLVE